MNEPIPPTTASDVPWPTSATRMPVHDTSMLPGSEAVPPAVVGVQNSAVQGAHDTVDRIADRAAPVVRQLGDGVAAAGDALKAKTDALRGMRDAWVDGARCTVRSSPLAAVVAAFALGAVIARITR
jgi:hypothetical protein